MKLKPHVSCHLLDVNTRFQIHISKHVEKSLETFRCLGDLLTPPFGYFCPPEGQKLPKHDGTLQFSTTRVNPLSRQTHAKLMIMQIRSFYTNTPPT